MIEVLIYVNYASCNYCDFNSQQTSVYCVMIFFPPHYYSNRFVYRERL